jgi:hypothetical protein
MGSRFTWRTFGLEVASEVAEYRPPFTLAWVANGIGMRGYHGWTIDPVADGSRVVTEEVQTGWLASLARVPVRILLRRAHRSWLTGIAEQIQRRRSERTARDREARVDR